MNEGSAAQNRRSNRSSVLLAARLKTRGGTMAVKLRNLSAEGALVEADKLPIEGCDVVFERDDLSVKGRVVWVKGKHAGVAFQIPLPPEQVLRNVPAPRPRMKPEFRRPGLASRTLTDDERRLVESWIVTPIHSPIGE